MYLALDVYLAFTEVPLEISHFGLKLPYAKDLESLTSKLNISTSVGISDVPVLFSLSN